MSETSIPSDISTPELTQRAHSFLIKQSDTLGLGPDAVSAAAAHLKGVAGEAGSRLVANAIEEAVRTIESERLSRTEIAELARDTLKDYKGGVEQMEAVLQHTAVVDKYLGEDAKKALPSVVPAGVAAWLRRAWACIGPVLKGCRSAGAVSVVVAQQVVYAVGVSCEEPDTPTLSRDTRLVVDDKAPVVAAAHEPTAQPAQPPQEENTQAPPADNISQTEATHQALA
jgi:hypothetical protein